MRDAALTAGDVLDGRYRIERPLGAGGMGQVYVGTRLDLDAPVAIKILSPQLAGGVIEERFRREAQVVARLQSPHVVSLIDFGVTDEGLLFQVMELVRGEPLCDLIDERDEPLSIDATLAILDQICAALEDAHASGVVHRDLKPANIMVDAGPRSLFVKVLDFGIAGLTERQAADRRLTADGMVQGTPHYMSPEQVVGSADSIDHRADLYALGVIAYELVTGAPPFDGETSVGVMMQHVQAPLEPIDRSLPAGACPPGLAALIERLLAKIPDDRPGSAQEVRDALRHIAPALTASGVTLTASRPAVTGANRRWPLAVAAVVALSAAAGALTWYALGTRSSSPAPAPDPPPVVSASAAPIAESAPRPTPAAEPPPTEPVAQAAEGAAPSDPKARRYGWLSHDGDTAARRYEAAKAQWFVEVLQRPPELTVGLPLSLVLRLHETDPEDGSVSWASPKRVEAWFETFRTHRPITRKWRPTLTEGRFSLEQLFAEAGPFHLRVLVWPQVGKPSRLTINFMVPPALGMPVPPAPKGKHHPHPTPWR